MNGAVSIISLGISLLALAVAAWAHMREHRLGKRMLALEEAREKDRQVAKQKALLVASLQKDRLLIENRGEGEGRDISVVLDGKPILQHPAVAQRQEEVRQLGPRSSCRYLLGISFQTPAPRYVEITWSDDSGEPGVYRTTLSL